MAVGDKTGHCPKPGHSESMVASCGRINKTTQARCDLRPHDKKVKHHCCGTSWEDNW